MPKAPVHENNLPSSRKGQIGAARQVSSVKPISKTQPMGQASDGHFRARIFLADALHDAAALLSCARVDHRGDVSHLVRSQGET
jgi:hypothetical protein